ncbi:protein PNS1-like isoform X1 [Olea europaea var. sylvestris]|uniref:Choline transporter-like protein n=2 Tax=Olea europaea subsp. europaea TaxID=158383 RepID=A0A8S0S1D5_OLEEU|nr:protein PNS1-like isoform X1 [Olea europaea var. sylvestris]CAA2985140.1 CTL DDB_G0274487 [Olea europaea subsp. europaea]
MGALEPVVPRKIAEETVEEEEYDEESKDLENGGVNIQERAVQIHPPIEFHMSRMQRLSATNPLRLVVENSTRVASPSPLQHPPPRPAPSVSPPPVQQPVPRSTPTPRQSVVTLNSRSYTNKISLFVFLVHTVIAIGLVGFLIFKGVQGLIEEGRAQREEKELLKYFLPQVEAASFLSITLAFLWQKAVRLWPKFMVHFIIWSSFGLTLSAGILLICFQRPATSGVGVIFIAFAIGNGLYACWVTQRTSFCSKIFIKALEPVSKFPDLNHPTYLMLGAGFLWMSFWILAVMGSLNFHAPPLIIFALVLSLAWTAEVMRNVANLTVSRVIALYYLRGMQSSTKFCFQRALSNNLGSACLGSLFVPAIEALRVVARGLNLIEGEDEFMFSCAHCCLSVMESIFKRGNGWAYVQIAAYGKGFVKASQDTWELFLKREMERIVDSDITSAICFLTGVCSGSMCTIMVAAWTAAVHNRYTATLSVLAAFIGYLMTRIAMALPQACVSCYYVCYAENPDSRLFDNMIPDRIQLLKSGRDVAVPTPRVPRRFTR